MNLLIEILIILTILAKFVIWSGVWLLIRLDLLASIESSSSPGKQCGRGWPQWKMEFCERVCIPIIKTLNLNGTRIRLLDQCCGYSVHLLNIRWNNFDCTNPGDFPTARFLQQTPLNGPLKIRLNILRLADCIPSISWILNCNCTKVGERAKSLLHIWYSFGWLFRRICLYFCFFHDFKIHLNDRWFIIIWS